MLLCLGLDYKRGGFVDRALEAFTDVLRLDPENQYALSNLEKLYEEQHQWEEAYATRQSWRDAPDNPTEARHHQILAFLENELGLQALKRMDYAEAVRRFEAAIELDARNTPAYLNLGDVRFLQGDAPGAIGDLGTARRHLARARLSGIPAPGGGVSQDGRRGALSRPVPPADCGEPAGLAGAAGAGAAPVDTGASRATRSICCSTRSCTIRTRSRCTRRSGTRCRQLDLPPSLVERYVDLTRDAIFYLDPHICVRCRYRSTELLWQCPHCHEWNTFIEERIAPAKDTEATLTS